MLPPPALPHHLARRRRLLHALQQLELVRRRPGAGRALGGRARAGRRAGRGRAARFLGRAARPLLCLQNKLAKIALNVLVLLQQLARPLRVYLLIHVIEALLDEAQRREAELGLPLVALVAPLVEQPRGARLHVDVAALVVLEDLERVAVLVGPRAALGHEVGVQAEALEALDGVERRETQPVGDDGKVVLVLLRQVDHLHRLRIGVLQVRLRLVQKYVVVELVEGRVLRQLEGLYLLVEELLDVVLRFGRKGGVGLDVGDIVRFGIEVELNVVRGKLDLLLVFLGESVLHLCFLIYLYDLRILIFG